MGERCRCLFLDVKYVYRGLKCRVNWENKKNNFSGGMFADNIDESIDDNELIEPVHDRMPVILSNEQGIVWLVSDMVDVAGLLSILKPYPAEGMNCKQGIGPHSGNCKVQLCDPVFIQMQNSYTPFNRKQVLIKIPKVFEKKSGDCRKQ